MNGEIFDELLESIHEGGAILRGEKQASRTFSFENLDVRKIRDASGLSQSEFATMLGINLGVLQNWEQGRRYPKGPAKVLLQVAQKHPEVIRKLFGSKKKK
jgi:putative transcriptional regulator